MARTRTRKAKPSAGTVTEARARQAAALLLKIACTVKPGRALAPGIERDFERALDKRTPAEIGRQLQLTPDLMASLCVRVIRARRGPAPWFHFPRGMR